MLSKGDIIEKVQPKGNGCIDKANTWESLCSKGKSNAGIAKKRTIFLKITDNIFHIFSSLCTTE